MTTLHSGRHRTASNDCILSITGDPSLGLSLYVSLIIGDPSLRSSLYVLLIISGLSLGLSSYVLLIAGGPSLRSSSYWWRIIDNGRPFIQVVIILISLITGDLLLRSSSNCEQQLHVVDSYSFVRLRIVDCVGNYLSAQLHIVATAVAWMAEEMCFTGSRSRGAHML